MDGGMAHDLYPAGTRGRGSTVPEGPEASTNCTKPANMLKTDKVETLQLKMGRKRPRSARKSMQERGGLDACVSR